MAELSDVVMEDQPQQSPDPPPPSPDYTQLSPLELTELLLNINYIDNDDLLKRTNDLIWCKTHDYHEEVSNMIEKIVATHGEVRAKHYICQLGHIAFVKKDFASAEVFFERALNLLEANNGTSEQVATVLINIADARLNRGLNRAAISSARAARSRNPDSLGEIQAMFIESLGFFNLGDAHTATRIMEEAVLIIAVREEINHPDMVRALQMVAEFRECLMDFIGSMGAAKRIVDVAEAIGDRDAVIDAHSHIGRMLWSLNRCHEAKEAYLVMLQKLDTSPGENAVRDRFIALLCLSRVSAALNEPLWAIVYAQEYIKAARANDPTQFDLESSETVEQELLSYV